MGHGVKEGEGQVCATLTQCIQKAHHICLLREDSIVKALWGHPPDGQFDLALLNITLSVVVLGVDVFTEAKVSHLDDIVKVYPVIR